MFSMPPTPARSKAPLTSRTPEKRGAAKKPCQAHGVFCLLLQPLAGKQRVLRLQGQAPLFGLGRYRLGGQQLQHLGQFQCVV